MLFTFTKSLRLRFRERHTIVLISELVHNPSFFIMSFDFVASMNKIIASLTKIYLTIFTMNLSFVLTKFTSEIVIIFNIFCLNFCFYYMCQDKIIWMIDHIFHFKLFLLITIFTRININWVESVFQRDWIIILIGSFLITIWFTNKGFKNTKCIL